MPIIVSRPHTPAPLEADCVLVQNGDTYVFTGDNLFASPSMAAIAVTGRSTNDWLEWKTDQGQTLDGAKRQSMSLADA